ncbi:leucine-rich repeat and death domain-containing protein 1 [Vombatus ursinus]|uniref:leucine-rich repeat and death domain-containing protein 1 n=1 Tax=Vombatus ursinus TaxID=29139 RepID=UPI000FFD3A10|nr:leucine-rich repeat and death domain-containing protein 1 [Vombatus ursinus]
MTLESLTSDYSSCFGCLHGLGVDLSTGSDDKSAWEQQGEEKTNPLSPLEEWALPSFLIQRPLADETPRPTAPGMLTQLSDELSNLPQLEILDISHNNIKELPKNIGELKSLVSFYASNNLINALPLSFESLNKLQHLNMSGNHLTTLPNSLNNLSSLKEINFDDNPLIKPPPEICKGKILNVIGHYLQKAEDRDEKILQKLFRIVSRNLSGAQFEFFCEKLQIKKPMIDVLMKKIDTKLEEAILEALNIWRVEKDPPLNPAVLRDQLTRIITIMGIQQLIEKVTALKLCTQLFKL